MYFGAPEAACKQYLNGNGRPSYFDATRIFVSPTAAEFDFEECAREAVREGFSYVGFMANTICYGLEDLPKKSTPSLSNCKPCVGAFSSNTCGSATGMTVYDVDSVAYFAPPPPDLDGSAPPDL